MSAKDGGQAFACASGNGHQSGMSLRDYFAGEALAAKTSPDLIGYEDHAPEHRHELIRRLVRDCYEIADAMLRERD